MKNFSHCLVILALLFAGIVSAHICLDDDNTGESVLVSVDSGSDVTLEHSALGCSQHLCQHDHHLYSGTKISSSSPYKSYNKQLSNRDRLSFRTKSTSLPARPPRA